MSTHIGGRRSTQRALTINGPVFGLDLTTVIDPRISFTRTPNGTGGYFDSTGLYKTAAINVPRFTYNPGTLAADGLLIEQAFTQNMLQTEDQSNAVYTKVGMTVSPNVAVAPDGTTTMDKYILDAAVLSGSGTLRQNFSSITTTGTYAFGMFVKVADVGYDSVRLILRDIGTSGNLVQAYFNITTGTVAFGPAVAGVGVTNPLGGIIPCQNGVYFVWIAGTFTTPTTSMASGISGVLLNYNNGSTAVTGDGTSGIYVWGWQEYTSSMPFLYLSATGSATARSADIATVSNISWLNRSAGTIYVEAVPYGINAGGNNQSFLSLSDGTTSNYWHLRIDASGLIRVSGVTASGGTPWNSVAIGAAIVPFAKQKLAFAWDASSASVARNGAAAIGSGGAFAFPGAISQMDIGNLAGNFFLNGGIRSVKVWNYRKSDAELVGMTT